VQRYVPEFEKRWSRYARPVGDSWRVAEKIKKGQFNLATLAGKPATAPEIWVAVLAA
jgi:hypothetical protein